MAGRPSVRRNIPNRYIGSHYLTKGRPATLDTSLSVLEVSYI